MRAFSSLSYLHTSSLHGSRSILNIRVQNPTTTTQNRLYKSLRDMIRALWSCMRVIIREHAINRRLPQRLEDIRGIRAMINELRTSTDTIRSSLRIRRKPARRVRPRPALPGVIRCLARQYHFPPLGCNRLPSVDKVRRECEYGDGLAIVCRCACLGASAGAVGAAVVRGEGAAVVVSEFDDDDVVGLDGFDDGVEAAFDCEGARGAAAEGLVAYGEGERVGEVVAPALISD